MDMENEKITVSFFGHRDVTEEETARFEAKLDDILAQFFCCGRDVDFLIGKNGNFDLYVASRIRLAKKRYGLETCALCLVMPYVTAELRKKGLSMYDDYDEVLICGEAAEGHYKSAYQTRNKRMVDRSDYVICYINHPSGGAQTTIEYALRKGKKVINLL